MDTMAIERGLLVEQVNVHIERLRDDALMIHDYPEQALGFIEEEIRQIRELLAQ